MRTIAHLSDLHFGAEDPAVVAALAADIAADPPDLVAVSGDLTQGARHSEFAAARAFLDALRAPVLAVPGNHDITPYDLIERFTDPYRRWRLHVGPETEPVWQDGHVAVIGLNTARRGGFYLNWARGRVGRQRLAALEQKLAALPAGPFRIVVAHHPFVAPALLPEARLVGGAATALAALARHGVGMLLSGHLHLPDVQHLPEMPPHLLPLQVVQAATSTSRRLRGTPNAYHRIRVENGRARVEQRVWDGSSWRGAAAPVLEA
jgi:3',5'-cyclic AMP phosphodiesterase CpdA